MPPTKRPGARRRSGSNCSFTRRIRSIAGTGPQVSTPALISGGPSRTTSAPPAAVQDGVDTWGPVPAIDLMRRVKEQFDPERRLAPGRFVGGI